MYLWSYMRRTSGGAPWSRLGGNSATADDTTLAAGALPGGRGGGGGAGLEVDASGRVLAEWKRTDLASALYDCDVRIFRFRCRRAAFFLAALLSLRGTPVAVPPPPPSMLPGGGGGDAATTRVLPPPPGVTETPAAAAKADAPLVPSKLRVRVAAGVTAVLTLSAGPGVVPAEEAPRPASAAIKEAPGVSATAAAAGGDASSSCPAPLRVSQAGPKDVEPW